MKTFTELLRNTPRDVQARAREVSVRNLRASHQIRKAMKAMVFNASCNAITETVLYDIVVELYPDEHTLLIDPDAKGTQPRVFDKPSLSLPAFVKCSCPHFLFFCEYALARAGSSEIDYSNGKPPYVTNPKMIPFVCKHLFAAAPYIIKIMQKNVEKDSRTSYQYV